jgi:hypothetical protein
VPLISGDDGTTPSYLDHITTAAAEDEDEKWSSSTKKEQKMKVDASP